MSSEPLIKDVHHLAAQVDEEEGQGPLGHVGGHWAAAEETKKSASVKTEDVLGLKSARI